MQTGVCVNDFLHTPSVSLLPDGAQPECVLLLSTQVLTSTEILAHRAEANRTRSLMWTVRTPDPLNYPLCARPDLCYLICGTT